MEVGVVLLASRSKSRQKVVKKVGESSKSPKSFKVWKICKGHRFGGTFTEVPVLCQRRTRASIKALTIFWSLFDSFSSSFCWVQELSQYHVWSDYQQGKASGAVDTLLCFSPEERRKSSSQKHSSFLPTITNGLSTPKFLSAHVFPPLFQLWDIPQTLRHQDDLRICCVRPSSHHILSVFFNFGNVLRKKSSQPGISFMAGGMTKKLYITKGCPVFLRSSDKILVVAATETTRAGLPMFTN